MKRLCSPLLVVLAVLTLSFAAFADESRYVTFVPTQAGPEGRAESVPRYAPGRVLVKFTAEAVRIAGIDTDMPRGTALAPVTGFATFDAACRRAGATRMVKHFEQATDRTLASQIGLDRWFVVEVDEGQDPLALARAFAVDDHVEAASPDWRAFPAAVPTDPLHSMHWGHNNTAQLLSYNWSAGSHESGSPVGTVGFDANAHAAWNGSQGYGSSSVIVAIIDSGVDTAHPDLTCVTGYDYGDNDSNPMDNSSEAGHGTCCAGVVASKANNGVGAAGIAANCKIMPLKVANSSGSMYFSAIQNALRYAGDNGAHIISMSLGAAISSDPSTDDAILYAYNKGCTILAATGNENASTISYPAINSYVIGIGAASPCGDRKRSSSSSSEVNPGVSTDPNGYTCDGERWWGSNYGSSTQNAAGAVDVIAPTILPTTDISGSGGYDSSNYFKWFNGTSCATPYAAGVCALIKSANPSFTNAQVRERLVTTAQDVTSVESGSGWDRYAGYGMVDAQAAVAGSTPTNSVTLTAPNGGQTLTAGASYTITWTSTGSIANVKLEYSTNAGSSWTTITSSTTNDGSQAWTVPSAATTQGRVRVSDAANSATNDISDANFTIQLPASYATLPYSTGFESGGVDQYWFTNSTGDGRVRFLTTNTPHSGSYHMCMDDPTSGGYTQNVARLRLNLSGQSQVELSFWWKDFGDETHSLDGVYFSSNSGGSFTKVYDLNGASYTNNTWYQFTLDVDQLAANAGLSLTSTFEIKFQQYDDYPMTTDGMAFDDISVYAPSTNSVTVTAPNGGETLTAGSSYNLTWTSTGSIANVKLEYSTNAGSSWTTITSSTTNDGSQAWTVPSTATTQGRVRVSDAANSATNDISNANFTIDVPVANSVTVTAPNGGETLTGGASYTVTWTSTGSIANVKLEYSTNAGSSWTTITSSTTNDGSQAWTVPSTATTQGRVRVSDAANSATNDISNANFTIQVSGPGYASLPYSTGFETGGVDQYWYTNSNNNGRIRFLTTNTPHGGSYHMCMDDATSGGYSQNVARLRLNLSGYTQVTLSFWWKDFGDETHSLDGIYFSSNSGGSFTKVYDLKGASYSNNVWRQITLDVDQLAANAGLALTSTFEIKFQQYDDYPMTTDGMAFDDVSVTGSTGASYITAESEPNNDSGTSDGPVGSGVSVTGSLSSSSDDDWFYFDVTTAGTVNISLSIGSSADLDWFLYNSSLTEVARGYSTSNPETGSYSATTGRYYLFVDGYLGVTSSYTLTVTGGVGAALAFGPPKTVPLVFELHQSSPNPMTEETTIRFELPQKSQTRLSIYDMLGREVARIVDRPLDAGSHSVEWDGRMSDGAHAAPGTYLSRIVTETDTATRRIVVLR